MPLESPPRRIIGLRELAARYDVILCDFWGVVHNGVVQYAKATDALRRFREAGGRVVLVTNAPRARARVQSFLDHLHVPREAYDGIVTSGDVTISLIRERAGLPLVYIGRRRICRCSTRPSRRSTIRCISSVSMKQPMPSASASNMPSRKRRKIIAIGCNYCAAMMPSSSAPIPISSSRWATSSSIARALWPRAMRR